MKHQKEQMNLFSKNQRLEKALETKKYLRFFKEMFDWEIFRPKLIEILRPQKRENNRGAQPYDELFMFKVLILGQIHGNIPPERLEGSINADITFQYFLDLSDSGSIPDESTIRNYRDALGGKFKELFDLLHLKLKEEGFILNEGSIVDATIINVPIQRNTKEENKAIKNINVDDNKEEQQKKKDEITKNWSKKKKEQKDLDARWKTKGNQRYFGYENHIKSDQKSKLMTEYTVTAASVHDSQELENLVDKKDKELWADSAYKSKKIDQYLLKNTVENHIHEKGYKNHPLTEEQKANNKIKSKVRARVEHVFAWMEQTTGSFIRTIGMEKAEINIGFMNLVYNIKRYCFLVNSGFKTAKQG